MARTGTSRAASLNRPAAAELKAVGARAAADWRARYCPKPLTLTSSARHCATIGQIVLCRSMKAYLTATPSQNTPPLFLGCRAPSVSGPVPPSDCLLYTSDAADDL